MNMNVWYTSMLRSENDHSAAMKEVTSKNPSALPDSRLKIRNNDYRYISEQANQLIHVSMGMYEAYE
jgi:hypothetical protein